MKVEVEQLSPEQVKLKVEVEPERVEKALDKAYRKLVSRYRIPGFRPGKAPRPIFERYVGRATLLEEALNDLIPVTYREAVEQTEITPFEEGNIVDVEPGDGALSFAAEVYLKPGVVLGDYRSLKVEKTPVEVTEEQVQDLLEHLRREKGILAPAEVVDKDSVVTVSGKVSREGEEPETFDQMDIPMSEAFPEIREGLAGLKSGDEKTVTYKAEDGKESTAELKVLEVKSVELPEVDEAFAREFGVEKVEELQPMLEKYLVDARSSEMEEQRIEKVLEEILGMSSVEVPGFLVDRELAERKKRDAELDEETERPKAEEAIRRSLVVSALIEDAGLEVLPGEIAAAVKAFQERTGRKKVTERQVRNIADALMDQKLKRFLASLGQEEQQEVPASEAKEGDAE